MLPREDCVKNSFWKELDVCVSVVAIPAMAGLGEQKTG